MLYIGLINRQAFLRHLTDDRVLILVVDAGWRGDSCWQEQGRHHFRAILLGVTWHFRTRPYKGHLAFKDIDQLRQFVQTDTTDEIANLSNAAIIS